MESLRKKWEDAKRKTFIYYISNINRECWVQDKVRRPIDCSQPYLITNMSINSQSPNYHSLSLRAQVSSSQWAQSYPVDHKWFPMDVTYLSLHVEPILFAHYLYHHSIQRSLHSFLCGAKCWATRRLLDYAYFAFDKFWSLSIRVDYNAPPSITWKFAFHTLPVPTNIPFRSLDELSQLQHPIAKFSSIKSHCTTPHVPRRKHFHITCLASS